MDRVARVNASCKSLAEHRQVTLEPPAGLKAGLYRTYSTMVSQELLDKWLDLSELQKCCWETPEGNDAGLLPWLLLLLDPIRCES